MLKKSLIILLSIISFVGIGQNAVVEFGKNKINIEEKFYFKLTLKGTESRPNVVFPEIEGFKKADKPSTTSVSLQNGTAIYTHTLIQNYNALREGTFRINKGTLKISENNIDYNEFYVTVFDQNKIEIKPKKIEYIEETDHALLKLNIDKSSVYKGEGIHLNLVFLTFEDNNAELEFPIDLSKTIEQFEKKLKPLNCVEEKTNLTDFNQKKVLFEGKTVNQYTLIETTYYPFDTKTIKFPALNLEMAKLKVANEGSIQKKIKIPKTFSSKPQNVSVKKLPPHPSENAMLVGHFELKEILKNSVVETGESFPLELIISGDGNFSLINQPNLENDVDFDFYTPIVKENIASTEKTQGKKHFILNIVAKKTGIKSLEKYINFIYFDTKKQIYDTLSPKSLIEITGKNINSVKTKNENSEKEQSIFDGLENEKIDAPFFDFLDFMRKTTNILASVMFCILIFLLFKNPK